MKKFRKLFAVVLAATMVLSLAACDKDKNTTEPEKKQEQQQSQQQETKKDATPTPTLAPIKLTISLPSDEEHLEANSWYDKLVKEINEYCNADITWEWAAQATYYDAEHLGLKLQTGDVADVIITGKDPAFLQAAEEGLFWDLSKYIDQFPNLATIPAATLQNVSYMGKIYGIPRSRTIGRVGFGYRLDWLNNLNLAEPTDWDSFVDMLYAFTYNDPDQNKIDDTVGLAVDSWADMWNVMNAWFGVPTNWGLDSNGKLVHKYMTEEYMTAMKAYRELFAMGVINNGKVNGVPDFIDVKAGKARTQLMNTGLCGVYVQCLDDARKIEGTLETDGVCTAEDPAIQLQGYVDTGKGYLAMPFQGGFNNLIAISTKNIKTEEQLVRVLEVIDKLSDGVMMNLIEFGWEGATYKLDENGYVELLTGDELSAGLNGESNKYSFGFNQIIPYYTAAENARPVDKAPTTAIVNLKEQELYKSNEEHLIPDYGAPYTSSTYVEIGADLDKIMADAQLAYIRNEIDDAAFQAAIQQWWKAGGETVTKEMNDAYASSKR